MFNRLNTLLFFWPQRLLWSVPLEDVEVENTWSRLVITFIILYSWRYRKTLSFVIFTFIILTYYNMNIFDVEFAMM
jgi:hypothetical protein